VLTLAYQAPVTQASVSTSTIFPAHFDQTMPLTGGAVTAPDEAAGGLNRRALYFEDL
jgi:hypothetical protein